MSDKFILFSDFHLHNHSNDWRHVDDALKVMDWILEESITRNITNIFFLGDFFHVRGYMYPTIVAKAYHMLNKYKAAGREVFMLVGNHDMPQKYTTRHNALTAFSGVANIIETPMAYEGENWNFYWLPYIENQVKVAWAIDQIAEEVAPDKKSCLLAHLDMQGAKYHSHVEATHGISSKIVSSRFDMVLSGHYHTHQKIDHNIWYIGSPYQQSFGETGEKKGFMVFNDGDLEFVENTFSPKYMYINSSQVNDSLTNNYVSIAVEDSNHIMEVREKAASFNPRHVTVKVDRTQTEENMQLVTIKQDAKDVGALLREWITKTANPTMYQHDKLLQYGISIVEESKAE
jgi:DNA repair exonuclease SbcCD nuclease subunit